MIRLGPTSLYTTELTVPAPPGLPLSAELLHKDALHLLGENAAAVLHEVRGPLQAIRAHVQIMERKSSCSDAEVSRHFQPIYQSIDQIGSLLDQFLRLSCLTPARMARLDLAECVRELLPLLRSMAVVRRIELTAEFMPAIPACMGDELQIKRLLFNLFSNACDAIVISATNGEDRKPLIHLRLTREAGKIALSVSDNGCGISSDKLERIWQPFYTSKATGTGLGLPNCLNITMEHNGELTVSSTPGKGSCFTLWLPILRPEAVVHKK